MPSCPAPELPGGWVGWRAFWSSPQSGRGKMQLNSVAQRRMPRWGEREFMSPFGKGVHVLPALPGERALRPFTRKLVCLKMHRLLSAAEKSRDTSQQVYKQQAGVGMGCSPSSLGQMSASVLAGPSPGGP